VLPYTGYAQHLALLEHGARIGAAKLWYDKPKKQFYLLVSLEVEMADPTPRSHQHVLSRQIVDAQGQMIRIYRTVKPKRHASCGMPSCGGV
jgi:hypothetical protein